MSVHHVPMVLSPEESTGSPRTGVIDSCELPCRCREKKQRPLEGQPVFLTAALSLQPPVFWDWGFMFAPCYTVFVSQPLVSVSQDVNTIFKSKTVFFFLKKKKKNAYSTQYYQVVTQSKKNHASPCVASIDCLKRKIQIGSWGAYL